MRHLLDDARYRDLVPSELVEGRIEGQSVNAYDALWMGMTGMLMLQHESRGRRWWRWRRRRRLRVMGKGGEPRRGWLDSVSFAGLLQRRVNLRPQFFIAGLRSEIESTDVSSNAISLMTLIVFER